MKFKIVFAAMLGTYVFLIPSLAQARSAVPIVNQENVTAVSSSGKAVTAAQFKQAVIAGAAKQKWDIAPQADGSYLATLVVRNRHTLVAKVSYEKGSYSVVYHSSDNLKYFVNEDGIPTIHPHANKWMQEFKDSIRTELLRD